PRSRAQEGRSPQGASRPAVQQALTGSARTSAQISSAGSPNHFGLPSTKRSAKWPKAILPIDDGGSSSGRTTVSDTVNPGSNPGPPANSHLAPSRREAFLPQRSRSAAARSLCPGVAQRHRAIEHGRSGLRVHEIGDEIAVPFELEMFA